MRKLAALAAALLMSLTLAAPATAASSIDRWDTGWDCPGC